MIHMPATVSEPVRDTNTFSEPVMLKYDGEYLMIRRIFSSCAVITYTGFFPMTAYVFCFCFWDLDSCLKTDG